MINRSTETYFPIDEKTPLIAECKQRVHNNETDYLKVIWHGYYVNLFEQGRVEWGRKFNFSLNDMTREGFVMPIVKLHIDFCRPLQYGELILIKTACHWTEAAKMNMSYEIYTEKNILSAKGYTVQLYTDLTGGLLLIRPQFTEVFFQNWDNLSINPNRDFLSNTQKKVI